MQGEYTKQRGRDKYGQAIWRQVNGAGWLFSSGPEGSWCFAKKESDIGKKLGQVQSASPHHGRAPHEVAQWHYHDWSTWRVDESIKVTDSCEEFERAVHEQDASQCSLRDGDRLWIIVPPYASLQGEYVKQLGRVERGHPVWRQASGNGTLFSTAKGRWFIADGEAGVAVNGGVIATAAHHEGRPPQDVKQWQYFHNGKWHVDPALVVTAKQEDGERRLADQEAQAVERASKAPDRIWLVCLPKPGLQGEYVRHQGRLERGEAVWQQVEGTAVLYSNGLGGLWCFANKETDIIKNVGILQSTAPHKGMPPNEVVGWQYADGSSWRLDEGILVTASEEQGQRAFADQHDEALRRAEAAPKSLWLVAPAQPSLQGEYAKQHGRIERGQACWRRTAGQGWLYSTAGGRWFVAESEDAITVCGGVIAVATPHGGRSPQECPQWQSYTDGAWHMDASIRITSERVELDAPRETAPAAVPAQKPAAPVQESFAEADAPERLWLSAPTVPRLEGEYVREGGRRAGLASWRHLGGAGWLYGRTLEGRWCVAAEESDVEAGRAVVRSAGSAASSPQEVERWQAAEESENAEGIFWRDEPSIRVSAFAKEARQAAAPGTPSPRVAGSPASAARVAGLQQLRLTLQASGGGQQVPTPRTAPSSVKKSEPDPCLLVSSPCSPSSPKMEVVVETQQPLTSFSCLELRDRIRTEVQRLLVLAGLSPADTAISMDVDILVDQCICELQEQDCGDAGPDESAVARVVMRSLLMGWGRNRSAAQPAPACGKEEEDGAADEGLPQLFGSCRPDGSMTRARRHFVKGATPRGISSDNNSAHEHDDFAVCHEGCMNPCSAGGCITS